MKVPFHETVETQASSALPPTGGYSSSSASHFRYREIFRFEHARTLVTGSRLSDVMRDSGPERVHSNLIQSVIEGLDILGVVTADRIEAHIVSEHVSGGSGEPTVTLAGTRFENLKIAGVPVEIDLATDVLDRYDTHAKFCEGYRGDERVRGLFRRN